MKKLLIILFIICVATSGCMSKESAERKAYSDINKELNANGHPTGMFGASWNMNQKEVRWAGKNHKQLDTDTLAMDVILYNRPAQASFHFTDDRLRAIVVTFKDHFLSPDELASAFYKTQDELLLSYGTMSDPVTNKIIAPVNGQWKDQTLIESTKQMGRTNLIHKVAIKNNSAGEQIIMYLSGIDF